MMRYIHYSKVFFKQLQRLRIAGKKAELAADKCEALLDAIKHSGCRCESVRGRRTRYGEYRLRSCVKYHLGAGYRLVTVKADSHLFICFVGDHDETDQWLENHRDEDLLPGSPLYTCEELISAPDAQAMHLSECNGLEGSDPYEDQLMAKLDEALLKSIFQGLFTQSLHEPDMTIGRS